MSAVHEDYMQEALIEARKAYSLDEVPVGAVIVKNDIIIARAHNMKESFNDATAHAEMLAIKQAQDYLKAWRLTDCSLYVTLEPCPMCAGAIINSRVTNLYFGAYDPKAGCCGSVVNLLQKGMFNHDVDVFEGILKDNCSSILSNYFKEKRNR